MNTLFKVLSISAQVFEKVRRDFGFPGDVGQKRIGVDVLDNVTAGVSYLDLWLVTNTIQQSELLTMQDVEGRDVSKLRERKDDL